jgi:hypothetical protein
VGPAHSFQSRKGAPGLPECLDSFVSGSMWASTRGMQGSSGGSFAMALGQLGPSIKVVPRSVRERRAADSPPPQPSPRCWTNFTPLAGVLSSPSTVLRVLCAPDCGSTSPSAHATNPLFGFVETQPDGSLQIRQLAPLILSSRRIGPTAGEPAPRFAAAIRVN